MARTPFSLPCTLLLLAVPFAQQASGQVPGSVNLNPTPPPDVAYPTFLDDSNALEGIGTELDGDNVGRGVAWVDVVGHDPMDPAMPGPPDGVIDLVLANSNSPALPLNAPAGSLLTPPIGTNHSSCKVFRGEPDGTFTDVTSSMGASGFGFDILYPGGSPWGVLPGDFDNDGDYDLFFPCGAFNTSSINGLLANDGDGTFSYISTSAGHMSERQASFGGSWFDLDRDGDLDLYVTNAVDILDNYYTCPPDLDDDPSDPNDPPACRPDPQDRLYRNNGDSTFLEIGFAAGTHLRSNGFGVVTSDLDRDGWTDVVVSCFKQYNKVFYNDGDGTFSFMAPPGSPFLLDINADMEPLDPMDSGGVWVLKNTPDPTTLQIIPFSGHNSIPVEVADLNGDGWPDILYGLWSAQLPDSDPTSGAGALYAGAERQYLYLNAGDLDLDGRGDGLYREVGLGTRFNHVAGTMGLLVADFNLDGYPDIYAGNGGPDVAVQLEEDFLYMNNGPSWPEWVVPQNDPPQAFPKTLYEVGALAGTYANTFMSHGVMVRVTRDSGTDIYVANGGPALNNQGQPNIYYRNQGNSLGTGYRGLEIGLTPDGSPPGAFGTRVTVSRRAEGGDLEIQMQERRSSFGFSSANYGPLVFGLGNSKPLFADVEWPTGIRQGRLLLDTLAPTRVDLTETDLSMESGLDLGGTNILIDFDNRSASPHNGVLRWQAVRASPHTGPPPAVPGLNGGTAHAAQKKVWAPGPWNDLAPVSIGPGSPLQVSMALPAIPAPVLFHLAYFEGETIVNATGLWLDGTAPLTADPDDAASKLAALGRLAGGDLLTPYRRPSPQTPGAALPHLTVRRGLTVEADRLSVNAPNAKLTHTIDLRRADALTLAGGLHARWKDGRFRLQPGDDHALVAIGQDGALEVYLGVPEGCCDPKIEEPIRILRFEGFRSLTADGVPYSTRLEPIGPRPARRPLK
ncbi:MAG: hypothetical protein CMJ89_14905 [Planctomycetes bacterium]|nr:hypothetical protein [Planctomycetota bacterium]